MISIKSLRKGQDTPAREEPTGLFVPDGADGDERAAASDTSDVLDVDVAPVREEPAARRSIFSRKGGAAPAPRKSFFPRKGAAPAPLDESIVEDATEVPRDEQAPSAEASGGGKPPIKRKGWFGRNNEKGADDSGEVGEPSSAPGSSKKGLKSLFRKKAGVGGAPVSRHSEVPVQIIMGFLPEVTSRDALEYAMGMSEKYVVQQGLAFFHATKYENGYLYEVHEGGSGKALGPEIAKYFVSKGPYQGDDVAQVTLATGGRMVEVTRQRVGLSAVLLPEASERAATDWLVPRVSMTPAIPRRKAMLYAGVGLLVSGVLMASATGIFFRLQGYTAAPAQANDVISARELPHFQWERLAAQLQPGDRVRALKYENNTWRTELFPSNVPPSAPTAPVNPADTSPIPSEKAPAAPSVNGAPQ